MDRQTWKSKYLLRCSYISSISEKTNSIPLLSSSLLIVKPGKLPASREKLSIPFNMVLEKSLTNELFETYHGVNINIQYKVIRIRLSNDELYENY